MVDIEELYDGQSHKDDCVSALQVELALDVERMVPDFIRRKFVVRKESLSPNIGLNVFFSRTFGLESYGLTAQTISKALNPELVSYSEHVHSKRVLISLYT